MSFSNSLNLGNYFVYSCIFFLKKLELSRDDTKKVVILQKN